MEVTVTSPDLTTEVTGSTPVGSTTSLTSDVAGHVLCMAKSHDSGPPDHFIRWVKWFWFVGQDS